MSNIRNVTNSCKHSVFLFDFLTMICYAPYMSTPNIQPPSPTAAVVSGDRALTLLRDALERQKLCDESLDVDAVLEYALANPTESVVDSFAAAEILSALDEVFGTKLPKQILNHKSLSTLDGLRRSWALLETRNSKKRPQRGTE